MKFFSQLRSAFLCITLCFLVFARPSAADTPNILKNSSPQPGNENTLAVLPPAERNVAIYQSKAPTPKDIKGWDHLFSLLSSSGLEANYVSNLLRDPRMPKKKNLYFSLEPKESSYLYRKHNTRRTRKNALRFFEKNHRYFKESAERFSVPQSIILAILQVETHCGAYTGRSRVFHRLARLASAAEPENIQKNHERHQKRKKKTSVRKVEKRAKWLEKRFLPHTVAVFTLSQQMQIHPLELRGSSSGAIGLPQFLPGNVSRYGVDADGDERIDLFSPPDAIFSVANFLVKHGWKGNNSMSNKAQKKVLYHYNRSDPYGKTVLSLARSLEPGIQRINKKLD